MIGRLQDALYHLQADARALRDAAGDEGEELIMPATAQGGPLPS
jgi:hypothetical protein